MIAEQVIPLASESTVGALDLQTAAGTTGVPCGSPAFSTGGDAGDALLMEEILRQLIW